MTRAASSRVKSTGPRGTSSTLVRRSAEPTGVVAASRRRERPFVNQAGGGVE
jgi:hypothetical protein